LSLLGGDPDLLPSEGAVLEEVPVGGRGGGGGCFLLGGRGVAFEEGVGGGHSLGEEAGVVARLCDVDCLLEGASCQKKENKDILHCFRTIINYIIMTPPTETSSVAESLFFNISSLTPDINELLSSSPDINDPFNECC
jgi:hypothetical protein